MIIHDQHLYAAREPVLSLWKTVIRYEVLCLWDHVQSSLTIQPKMPVDNRQYHDYDGQHDDFVHLRLVILSAAKDLSPGQPKPLQQCHPSLCHPERSEGSLLCNVLTTRGRPTDYSLTGSIHLSGGAICSSTDR